MTDYKTSIPARLAFDEKAVTKELDRCKDDQTPYGWEGRGLHMAKFQHAEITRDVQELMIEMAAALSNLSHKSSGLFSHDENRRLASEALASLDAWIEKKGKT